MDNIELTDKGSPRIDSTVLPQVPLMKQKADHHFNSMMKTDNCTLMKNNAVVKYRGYSNMRNKSK